jgi:uncharacterized membrane protein (GlpM family)
MLVAAALIGVASWIGKRRGPGASGWFVALPLISGPIVLTFALERGPQFVREACVGAMLAIISLSAFALAYSWLARRTGWAVSAALACLLFVASTWALQLFRAPPIGWTFALACVVLAGALYVMPAGTTRGASSTMPSWDIPVRMLLAAALVLTLSIASSFFGPRVSGLLTPFPITSTILVSFTHHNEGAAATSQFLRGLLKGMFSFAVFVLVVGVMIGTWSIAATFITGTIVTLIVHAGVWQWVQHHQLAAAPSRAGVVHD